MDLSLEQRLLRFLQREEEDERRVSEDLRALSVGERVLEGECIEAARYQGREGPRFVFQVTENLSKFRHGDPLVVSDGLHLDRGLSLAYGDFDEIAGRLVLERDPFSRADVQGLVEGEEYCIDRRSLGIRGRLREALHTSFADPRLAEVLNGAHRPEQDAGRLERALKALTEVGLNEGQARAGAAAIATESLALIQGPPGTGKTRLLGEIIRLLCGHGCRIALTAFTHRAVDNALLTLRRLDPEVEIVKLGRPRVGDQPLLAAGVRFADPRKGRLPMRGVIAGTCFALAKLPDRERFHLSVFDEAGQMPIPHALPGMLLARRWVFLGDHRQLPPVVTAEHADREVTRSIFERLHEMYGSSMLSRSYRMNDGICDVVGRSFYQGELVSDEAAAGRRIGSGAAPEEGALETLLAPDPTVVMARVDHGQPGQRSREEAHLVADLVRELVTQRGVEPREIAVIAPFRAQVRLLRTCIASLGVAGTDEVTVDTVERIQGQERDVVILSLAVGDPDSLAPRAAFFFSENRLNVALSRARRKVILVASGGAFEALPQDPVALRAAARFKRLLAELPQVDLSPVYSPKSPKVR